MNKITRYNKGDTIIEVMISMAILSLILGGAYFTANQSLANIRAANEHSIAINIAQSQIEEIKLYNANNPNNPFDSITRDACLDSSLNPQTGLQETSIVSGISYWCKAPVNNPSNILTALPSPPLNPAPAFYYDINVTWSQYSQTSSTTLPSGAPTVLTSNFNVYKVTVNWATSAITGSTRNQVILNYRSN